MEFKIGDKVLVVGDEKYYWVMEMNDYIGKVFTVSSVSYNCDGQVVKFEECKWKFSFSAHDLKLVEDNEFMKYGFEEFTERDNKMKYKVGDKVRVIGERGGTWNIDGKMDMFMGETVTIKSIDGYSYSIEEDDRWSWNDDDFVGLAEDVVVDKPIDVDKLYTTIENQQNEIEELEDDLKSAKEIISKYFDEIAKYTEIEYILDKRIKQLEHELLDYYIAEITDMTVSPEGTKYLEDDILDLIEKEIDVVNHPKHYTFGEIEVIDAIEDWDLPYHLGNVVKYVARAKHKENELQDLLKSQWYLNRYIELLRKKEGEKYCEEID